jgi:hypothetical protein
VSRRAQKPFVPLPFSLCSSINEVKFQVLTAASMNMAVFWVGAPCSLVEVYLRSIIRATHRPSDGGSKHLWNVGKPLPDYMAQQPRRQPSSIQLNVSEHVRLSTGYVTLHFDSVKMIFYSLNLKSHLWSNTTLKAYRGRGGNVALAVGLGRRLRCVASITRADVQMWCASSNSPVTPLVLFVWTCDSQSAAHRPCWHSWFVFGRSRL